MESDLEEKFSILGKDSLGHCEKKKSLEHMSKSEWLPG